VFAVRATDRDRSAMAPINRGFFTASILTVIGTLAVALFYIGNDHDNEGWKVFGAVVAGLVLAQVVSRLTEHFTSTDKEPVQEIADSARTGPATTILSGTSTGLESTVWAIVAISVAIGVAIVLGGGNIEFSFYLVALTGMGMLATTGVVVSEDTFGPVADNAAGIAEMSGEFGGEPERIMVSLDAVGNTTKAVTKGFAIGSAVIAAVALFASFIETIGSELNLRETGSALFGAAETHRPTRRRVDRVPVQRARDSSCRPHRRNCRAGRPRPVLRRQDHGRDQGARQRADRRHLHRRVPA
jgi:K(+)-stimulated pyrophosphate-energized sodium pump